MGEAVVQGVMWSQSVVAFRLISDIARTSFTFEPRHFLGAETFHSMTRQWRGMSSLGLEDLLTSEP
jgi:hypothetical protein